jgi:hypothetical protein
MSPPKKNTKEYKEIVNKGCGLYYTYNNGFDCFNKYEWDCDECPVFIETEFVIDDVGSEKSTKEEDEMYAVIRETKEGLQYLYKVTKDKGEAI